jgi:phosphoglycolate phosphatase
MTEIAGILFDKDGTLFDFHATWAGWASSLLLDLAGDDADRATVLGRAVGYDMTTRTFARDSVAIAGTPEDIGTALLTHLPGASPAGLVARMNTLAATAHMIPVAPLAPLMTQLRDRALRIGLATNDAEAAARSHLAAAGIEALFDFVAGYDSGFGTKPGPGMLLAYAERCGLAPGQVVMVGDSRHDLLAGRAAGMRTVAVLTGLALHEDLAPLADAVLPDIAHLPAWLDRIAGARSGPQPSAPLFVHARAPAADIGGTAAVRRGTEAAGDTRSRDLMPG